jgi:hypothetical protein
MQRWKLTKEEKKSWTAILIRLSEKYLFRIIKCFQRSQHKLYASFSLSEGSQKIAKPFVHVQKILSVSDLRGLQKIFIS